MGRSIGRCFYLVCNRAKGQAYLVPRSVSGHYWRGCTGSHVQVIQANLIALHTYTASLHRASDWRSLHLRGGAAF